MRIAFYAPLKPPTHGTPSGDRRMARLLIQALEHAGHSVALASSLRSYDATPDGRRQAEIAAEGRAEAERLIAAYGAGEAPKLWFTYHLYYRAPDWLGPVVSGALGIPYLVAEASHAPKRANGPWRLGHEAAAAAIRAADAVFCMTALDQICVRPLMRDPSGMRALPPFLDAAPFVHAATERGAARRALAAPWGLDLDLPWLLAVGMLRPGDKLASYRLLAEALIRLDSRPWQLVIVGDGEAAAEVREAFAPIAARVRFLGGRDPEALPAIYAACDLYVWPAINEAYGMALLEAQAAGLAVVAGRVRGVPNVVREGETAVLVPEWDSRDFADAVAALLDDPPRRAAMAAAATAFVANERAIAPAAALLNGVVAEVCP